ncbi:MAG: F0F1 ATP synthase subunit alpha [bacterium]|nr:F0F1 ATP synthase subunit alpha [bacterium]
MSSFIEDLEKHLSSLSPSASIKSVGTITELGDGIVTLSGLEKARMSEVLRFETGVFGLVLNLNRESIGAVVLGELTGLSVGQSVESLGILLSVPAGNALLGRVVNALGQPVDGKGTIKTTTTMPVEQKAPGVIERKSVDVPLQTGVKAIDVLVPIGRGQRELIIGDRQTGKSTVALQSILNQKDSGVISIYVAIGQKASFVAQTVALLEKMGAMKNTIVVVSDASDAAAMQYIAPYAGTAMAEYFLKQGQDVLIVYDDLSKHAWAYRQMSLLLRRPSGREAYPGDVFYLHSRLLERACRIDAKYGGGSITALPIIETQANDISAYIPTNVISITDGQIFLETDLFYAGVRPAINVGTSVSRVGSSAQTKAMKKVAGKMKIELSQYRELAAFSQFASDLDDTTKRTLDRGARLTEILKQGTTEILSLAEQVVQIWAVSEGFANKLDKLAISDWGRALVGYMRTTYPELLEKLNTEKVLTDDIVSLLKTAVSGFQER